MQQAVLSDGSSMIEVLWFNQPYLVQTLRKRPLVRLVGKIKRSRDRTEMISPQIDYDYDNSATAIHSGRVLGMYQLTAGISQKRIRRAIHNALASTAINEWLPDEVLTNYNLLQLTDAFASIHFPEKIEEVTRAKQRLAFDELVSLQLLARRRKLLHDQDSQAPVLNVTSNQLNNFIQQLPFTLTPDQRNILDELVTDIQAGRPAHRLIQGDVGSGKTVFAAFLAYACALSGKSAILMAPTGLLARQHFESLHSLLAPYNLTILLQTKDSKPLETQASLVVGTHALLYRELPSGIGAVVIDEQHRFGVAQRVQLKQLGTMPHLYMLTATPIPRSIAQTIYADLELSLLQTMPIGRKPIVTRVLGKNRKAEVVQRLFSALLKTGAQAFIVCPLIEPSEEMPQVQDVTTLIQELAQIAPPDIKIGMLHGGMKEVEKQKIIKQFKTKELQIIVSTPVIEVGIDIPNATYMVIMSADRFGLASLHQLRGRVGRSDQQSYCIVISDLPTPSSRLTSLTTITSGQELSELDLSLRGPGEIFGLKQSGYLDLKCASLNDIDLITKTKAATTSLLTAHSKLPPECIQRIEYLLANQA